MSWHPTGGVAPRPVPSKLLRPTWNELMDPSFPDPESSSYLIPPNRLELGVNGVVVGSGAIHARNLLDSAGIPFERWEIQARPGVGLLLVVESDDLTPLVLKSESNNFCIPWGPCDSHYDVGGPGLMIYVADSGKVSVLVRAIQPDAQSRYRLMVGEPKDLLSQDVSKVKGTLDVRNAVSVSGEIESQGYLLKRETAYDNWKENNEPWELWQILAEPGRQLVAHIEGPHDEEGIAICVVGAADEPAYYLKPGRDDWGRSDRCIFAVPESGRVAVLASCGERLIVDDAVDLFETRRILDLRHSSSASGSGVIDSCNVHDKASKWNARWWSLSADTEFLRGDDYLALLWDKWTIQGVPGRRLVVRVESKGDKVVLMKDRWSAPSDAQSWLVNTVPDVGQVTVLVGVHDHTDHYTYDGGGSNWYHYNEESYRDTYTLVVHDIHASMLAVRPKDMLAVCQSMSVEVEGRLVSEEYDWNRWDVQAEPGRRLVARAFEFQGVVCLEEHVCREIELSVVSKTDDIATEESGMGSVSFVMPDSGIVSLLAGGDARMNNHYWLVLDDTRDLLLRVAGEAKGTMDLRNVASASGRKVAIAGGVSIDRSENWMMSLLPGTTLEESDWIRKWRLDQMDRWDVFAEAGRTLEVQIDLEGMDQPSLLCTVAERDLEIAPKGSNSCGVVVPESGQVSVLVGSDFRTKHYRVNVSEEADIGTRDMPRRLDLRSCRMVVGYGEIGSPAPVPISERRDRWDILGEAGWIIRARVKSDMEVVLYLASGQDTRCLDGSVEGKNTLSVASASSGVVSLLVVAKGSDANGEYRLTVEVEREREFAG